MHRLLRVPRWLVVAMVAALVVTAFALLPSLLRTTPGQAPTSVGPTGPTTSSPAPSLPTSSSPAPPTPPGPTVSPVCARSAGEALTPAAVAAENARTGDTTWQRVTIQPGQVLGYLDRPSYVCGDTLRLHVSSPAGRAHATVVRFGWYAGAGSRVVWRSDSFTVATRALPGPRGPSRLMAADWPVSLQVPIPPSWPPGPYGVLVQDQWGNAPSLAPFTLRADSVATPLLVIASDLTWAAYNEAGGASLYHGVGETREARLATRAREVSLARPLVGSGMNQFLNMNLPLARLLDRYGLVAAWASDTDLDARTDLLSGHRGIVIPGHSEYWSRAMYDAALEARDQGTNLAFLGANQVYWQTRVTRRPDGSPDTMVVYRDATDPMATTDPDRQTTRWADPPLDRDSIRLTGQTFSSASAWGPMRVMRPGSWILEGTGLAEGAMLAGLSGNEVDSARPGAALPGDPPVEVLLQGMYDAGGHLPARSISTTYYSAPSGAGVFSAGTTYWPCVAVGSCPRIVVPRATARAVARMTRTVLTAFGQPRAGATHPSTPSALLPADRFERLVGPAGIASSARP